MILVINPGSTSTKVAIYKRDKCLAEETIRHSVQKLEAFERVADQKDFRQTIIVEFLQRHQVQLSDLQAIVGRGGLLRPITGGTYLINLAMLDDLQKEAYGTHVSNLGALLAYELARPVHLPAYIVDPVVTDELAAVARYSGLKGIERRSVLHALNHKAVARQVLENQGRRYEESQVIVAHLGGGVSIAAHKNGRMIDVINALDGEGPFSPERTGGLPLVDFAEKIITGQLSQEAVKKIVAGDGGLKSYLGETDLRLIEQNIRAGDTEAQAVLEAMCYQIAKGIGEMAIPLQGKVASIILTGGMAYSASVTQKIAGAVDWLAEVVVFPGEVEMLALAQGAQRILDGIEKAKVYP